jgi:hypothetical protein
MAGKIPALTNGTLNERDSGSYGGASDPLLPNMINVTSATGCTLTRADISGMTPDTFEQLAMVETDLARVIANAAEAKILGVQEKGLATLLKSSLRDIKPALTTSKIDEQSLILPYIQRRQRGHQNANYFQLTKGGTALDSAAKKGTTLSKWTGSACPPTMTSGGSSQNTHHVVVTSGAWGEDNSTLGIQNTYRGGPTEIDRYFLPGMSLIIYTLDGSQKSKVLDLEIVDAYEVTAAGTSGGGVIGDIILELKDRSLTTAGVIAGGFCQIGTNNVSDWEEWCRNQPSDMNQRIIVNWLQTSRETRQVDGVYKDTLQKILDGKVNPYAAGFKYLPLAEQNKIAAGNSENAWLRSTFFGQAISDSQTVEGYSSLPQVHDPESGSSYGGYPGSQPTGESCPLEYKANAIGIYTQLVEAARVADFGGGQLDLDALFQLIYYLKRYRESDGDSIDVIDCMTDRYTADNLMVAFSRYYQAKYGAQVNRFVDQGKKLTFDNQVMFNYNVYDIPEIGVQLAVFHDQFFDDHLSASKQAKNGDMLDGSTNISADAAAANGRHLWMLDWSDINVGIAGTNSVTRKHPNVEAQELYKCRMEANVKEYQLKSTKWTTMLDRPQRHLVVRNFSADLPSVSTLGLPLIGDGTATASDGTTVPAKGAFNATDWNNIP